MVANLIFIMLNLFGFGWLYAWRIYEKPITPTWVSVAIGTGAICSAEMVAIGTVLANKKLLKKMWWMTLIPPMALGLAGGPMAIMQQKKWLEMSSHNTEVVEIWKEN